MPSYVPFNDQMNANNWDSTVEFYAICKRLQELGWIIEETHNVGFCLLNKDGKTAEVAMAHPNITDRDYIILDSALKRDNALSLSPGVYGNFYHEFKYTNCMPTKLYNCFIYRSDQSRQSWFYKLVQHNILHKGNVTYWCHDADTQKPPIEYFEQLHKGNEIFDEEYNYIKKHLSVPYKNFSGPLEQAILDTQKSFTIETFFAESNVITLSEKTWRSLQMPRPFLIFGHPGSIQQLRYWGFDVYDDYVDHGYDAKENWLDRQQIILQELAKPIEYTPEILEEFEQRAYNNRQLLKKYKQKFTNYFDKFLYNLKDL